MGWKKYMRYLLIRLSRLGSSPYSVASGLACGVAVSFTPFVGVHLILAAITAFLCKGNILASALGTAMGNPWTFPFIWISVFYTGHWFLGQNAGMDISFLDVFEKGIRALLSFDFSSFATDVWPVFYPMLIGCIPFYIASWLVTFYIVRRAMLHFPKRKGNKI